MVTTTEEEGTALVPSQEKEERSSTDEPEEQPASICETTTDDNDDDNDEDYFADVGFMFEAWQPTKLEHFQWDIPASTGTEEDGTTTTTASRSITVALHVADEDPGAVQSGHYLWPAAAMLAEYLVLQPEQPLRNVVSVVELGAGCALASLTALQLWQDTMQCLVVTDHDPGTLVRARDNLETTVQHIIVDLPDTDEDLNSAINMIANIPVLFETLEWGDSVAVDSIIQNKMQEHMMNASCTYGQSDALTVDVVLGSDLIYCAAVVEPLLQTAAQLIGQTGRFMLSQSFAYEPETETEIDRVCTCLGLKRIILVDEEEGVRRIQEFTATTPPAPSEE